MSGGFADLDLVRSRIATELDRLRNWVEDGDRTEALGDAAPLAATGPHIPTELFHHDDAPPPALELLAPPRADLAAGTAWLAEWHLTPPGGIAAEPAVSSPMDWRDPDDRLETAVALLLDTAPAGLGSPGTTGALVILNAAFIPGWPFPDALVRDRLPAPRSDPALAALGDGFSTMSEAERAAYLARLGLPFQLPAQLRTLLDRTLDPKVARGLLLAFLEALSTLVEGLARFEAELSDHRAARERLADAMPRHPGGKTRLQV
ncbi:hypothetical protein [Roseicyclus amphidinii]|uniref:hypothetical protein n=1 Tax=Roseicyclus amphidinii TaxID=3034232 RepID=UPI0024E10153|nr:hypothetical protein [Roseicyclus sp. Amp-Y-6]